MTSPQNPDTAAPRPLRETYAARYYSLFSALLTLLVSAIVARLLDMDFKEILILAGGIGATALGSAIPTERSVWSQRSYERDMAATATEAQLRGAQDAEQRINSQLNDIGEQWENHMEIVDVAIGTPNDDDWLDDPAEVELDLNVGEPDFEGE